MGGFILTMGGFDDLGKGRLGNKLLYKLFYKDIHFENKTTIFSFIEALFWYIVNHTLFSSGQRHLPRRVGYYLKM